MNKVISIIALLLLCLPTVSAQETANWASKQLKGKVKSISKRTFKYNQEKKGACDMSNHAYLFKSGIMHDYDWTFDKDGNRIQETTYRTSKSTRDSVRAKYDYEYNSTNTLVKATKNNGFGTNEKFIHYVYDDQNHLITIDQNKGNKYGNGSTKFKYDDKGHLIQEMFIGSRGGMRSKIVYENNTNGQKTKATRYTYNRRKGSWMLDASKTFRYNDDQQLIRIEDYLKDGRLSAKHSYEYDASGNIIKDTKTIRDGTVGYTVRFEFEMDDNNNWTKAIVYRNESTIYLVERTIVYF